MLLKNKPNYGFWKDCYDEIYKYAYDKFEDKNDLAHINLVAESMYGIVSTFGYQDMDSYTKFMEAFRTMGSIGTYTEYSHTGGYALSGNVKLNLYHLNSNEEFVRVLTHELCHIASYNYVNGYFESGGVSRNLKLTSVNEALTVFMEDMVAHNCFNFANDKTFSVGLNSDSTLSFENSLDGYHNFSEYSKFLIGLEGSNLIHLYFKTGQYANDDALWLNDLSALEVKFEKLNNCLDVLRDYDRYSASFSSEDNYLKVNNELFNLLKEQIDEGMSLERYIMVTDYLQRNLNINVSDSKGVHSVTRDSLEMLDIYYTSKILESNPSELSPFLKKKLSKGDLTDDLIHDRANGYSNSLYLAQAMNGIREGYHADPTYFQQYEEQTLERFLISHANSIITLYKQPLEIDNIEEVQMKTNYLVFAEGDSSNEKYLKLLLNEDKDLKGIKEKINQESLKYNVHQITDKSNFVEKVVSKVAPKVQYNERFLMDLVTKTSDLEYFDRVVSHMSKTNSAWFNEMLNTPCEIDTERGPVSVTPMEYAINNSRPGMFMILANHSDGNFEKVNLTNINGIAKHYSNLNDLSEYTQVVDIQSPSRKLQKMGYKTIFDMVELKDVLANSDTYSKAYFSLIEDYSRRPNNDLEYNLEKLSELGCYVQMNGRLITDGKGDSIIDKLMEINREDIILRHMENNNSSLKFDLTDSQKLEVINTYIVKNPEKMSEMESKYSQFIDYNGLCSVYNEVIKDSINKGNFKDAFDAGKGLKELIYDEQRLGHLTVSNMMQSMQSMEELSVVDADNFNRAIVNKIDSMQSFTASTDYVSYLVKNLDSGENSTRLDEYLQNDRHNFSYTNAIYSLAYEYRMNPDNNFEYNIYQFFQKSLDAYKNHRGFDVEIQDEQYMIMREDIGYSTLKAFNNIDDRLVNHILKNHHPVDVFGYDNREAVARINMLLSERENTSDVISLHLKDIREHFRDNDYKYECETAYRLDEQRYNDTCAELQQQTKFIRLDADKTEDLDLTVPNVDNDKNVTSDIDIDVNVNVNVNVNGNVKDEDKTVTLDIDI